jgi:hypothetical protein
VPRSVRILGLGVASLLAASGCLGPGEEARDAGPPGPRDGGPRDAGSPGPQPVFPADVERRYTELRGCRESHEHELHFIRVLVSQSALEPYQALSPDVPYPEGATLVKLEYDDEACAELVLYTAYEKLAKGANPAGGDWLWQKVGPQREVIEHGAPWRCINCHTYHCAPPYGYDLTCAEEL